MTDELLIRFLLNEATEEENKRIQDWIAASPANQIYYAKFEKIWKAGKKLASKSDVDVNDAWIKFKSKIPVVTVIKPITQKFNWLKIAAVIVVIAGAWATYSLFGPSTYKDLVARNQVITQDLPDGSRLTLNKNSAVSYAANFKNHRSVKLTRGNVFFNVAHDKHKPFVIEIDKISVTVVGTSFNIKYLNRQTEVIVETGIVRVRLNKEKIELHKGEKILISTKTGRLIKEQNKDQLYNYYRSKLFIASNTPLSRLIATLNEAYGSEVVLQDTSLNNEPISTTLKQNNGLDRNLKTICETLPFLKMTRNENKILLSKIK